jgi:hypothetical protein
MFLAAETGDRYSGLKQMEPVFSSGRKTNPKDFGYEIET